MPNISVVVPVYNVEQYLCRCVESILNQTYVNFELILVDDGSPDQCGELCELYAAKDRRVHVIHQQNGGLSVARNTGIDWAFSSDSEWITFIDSDDWIRPEYLEVLLERTTSNKVKVGVCSFSSADHAGNVTEIKNGQERLIAPEKFWCEAQGNATVAWGKIYRKDLFSTIRYPAGKIHEDEFTTYKLLFSQSRIFVTSADLYLYCTTSPSIMRSQWNEKKLVGLEAYEEQILYFKRNNFRHAQKESIKRLTFALLDTKDKIKDLENRAEIDSIIIQKLSDFLVRYYHCPCLKNKLLGRLYRSYLNGSLFISVRIQALVKIYKKSGWVGIFRKIVYLISKYNRFE